MKVITLLENRTISKDYGCRHGLSLYIETSRHKILFDTGPDETFAENALKLGVSLKDVDIAVISHGHYDHGGGLKTFLNLNDKASIYIGKGAFTRHFKKIFRIINYNIGLKKELEQNSRMIFVDGMVRIDDELTLFGDIEGEVLFPKGNSTLYKEYKNGVIKDDFNHEINLLISEREKYSLFCGCAHKGIVNIISKAEHIINNELHTVIGGFHLMRMNPQNSGEFLHQLSKYLENSNVRKLYTCHCTGEGAYNILKKNLDHLYELKTGDIIEI